MNLANILLVLAFLVGCLGIIRKWYTIRVTIALCLAFGAGLFVVGWWANNPNRPLRAALSTVSEEEMWRLEQSYPLGFAVIAVSGKKNLMLPPTSDLEVDWNNLRVYTTDQGKIAIHVAYLQDKQHHIAIQNIGFVMPAISGVKTELHRVENLVLYGECLQLEPVGLVVFGLVDEKL